jgi:tetratricopeptide (TPR) repeat protein
MGSCDILTASDTPLGKLAEDEMPPPSPSKEELQDAAEAEFAEEDYDAAGEKFWELAQIANQEGDHSMEMTCYKNIGTCLIYLEEANEALHHWHKALQVPLNYSSLTQFETGQEKCYRSGSVCMNPMNRF